MTRKQPTPPEVLAELADLLADLGPVAAELDALADRAARLEAQLRRAEEASR